MILRVSIDPRSADGLRIHVRLVSDVARGVESSRVLSDIDGALELMRDWLNDISARNEDEHP